MQGVLPPPPVVTKRAPEKEENYRKRKERGKGKKGKKGKKWGKKRGVIQAETGTLGKKTSGAPN